MDLDKAAASYNIPHWSEGYFAINRAGHLIARPTAGEQEVDLYELVRELRKLGLAPPVLVRFTDILRHRIDTLCIAFDQAMASCGYAGAYTAAYPIKVNQQRRVVTDILAHGGERVGLEAGSKSELLAVLALTGAPGRMVLCNGYKDQEYIRLALMGQEFGHRVHIVVEKPCEVDLALDQSAKLGIVPLLGLRVRLASVGLGRWQNTGGDKSKFGLDPSQVLRLIEHLRQAGRLDCLRLMHFHLGSQIPNIRDIQRGLTEAARFYAELRRLGADIRVLDVGGGLAVDYQGTGSRDLCSMNYTVTEYANNVVHAIWEVCDQETLPHPEIVTEAGRAMAAHHAMLITQVVDVTPAPGREAPVPVAKMESRVIRDLWRAYRELSPRTATETYHDAQHWLAEAQGMFIHGGLSLTERARVEGLYFAICQRVRELLSPASRSHREVLDELNEKLADKYVCNFSLFQSLPDAWAIDQIFPVVPLHRLDEEPTRHAVIHDITCDSDGQLKRYVDARGLEASLPLHSLRDGHPYVLGIFLLGAYQEILGDVHNLFGDSHSANVELSTGGGYRILDLMRGETVRDVLRHVHMDAEQFMRTYREQGQRAGLSPKRLHTCLEAFRAGIDGYTYLED